MEFGGEVQVQVQLGCSGKFGVWNGDAASIASFMQGGRVVGGC
jgi:hypothetical protein